jgi:hypothetical protein
MFTLVGSAARGSDYPALAARTVSAGHLIFYQGIERCRETKRWLLGFHLTVGMSLGLREKILKKYLKKGHELIYN